MESLWQHVPTFFFFTPLFSSSVGTGHILLGTRADWREHMLRARDKLGFIGVRGHGVLDDDMSVIIDRQYHFYNVDQVFISPFSLSPDSFIHSHTHSSHIHPPPYIHTHTITHS